MDYNNYYTTGNNIGYLGVDVPTFADWQVLVGLDSNSISAPPLFTSDTTVQVNQALLNEAGVPITGIDDDINGDTRNNPPDIGADEFRK